MVCERLRDWEDLRDSHISKELGFVLSPRQEAFLNFLERCAGNDCIEFRFASDDEDLITEPPKKAEKMMIGEDWRCSHSEISWRPRFCSQETIAVTDELRKSLARRRKRRESGQQPKAIRKEYRLMSDDERARLVSAMQRMKQGKIDGISKWDIQTARHYPDNAPGAHWGPAFLPWHREFLRQFEVALRNEEPDVALPFWDSTLDHGLPDPRDSVLWTEELFGNGDGYVTTGPSAHWSASVPLPGSDGKVNSLY
uniref:Tyrosinase copper-binding domain-containing protein n=1 Tax=Plectus sambesii TaxID=2011161 RepID=A0A914VXJ7_9BILA